MKVAIVHDWLVTYGGAERVLEQLLILYPEADLYSLIDDCPEEQRAFLGDRPVRTSYLQKVPFVRRYYRSFLTMMPLAIEQFDLSTYDLVISSSHTVAKGVLTGPDQLHVCLCYSPVRYAWDLQHQYLNEAGIVRGLKGFYARLALHKLRLWDYRTAAGVDNFIAISDHIARRIWKVYRRKSTVIYPPVDLHNFIPGEQKEDYYLTVSRMVPYKKVNLLAQAFSQMPDKKLVIIGDGPDYKKVQRSSGPNVELLGYRPFEDVISYIQRAKAFVFAALEDFGIVVLEAQACGTPVIAYGRGGALEIISDLDTAAPTGLLFEQQSTSSIIAAVEKFESVSEKFTADNCRNNVVKYSPEGFRDNIQNYIARAIRDHGNINRSEY